MFALLLASALAQSACATGSESPVDAGDGDGAIAADAAVDADPGPDACVDSALNLLVNGDFEAGEGNWTAMTNGALPIIRELGAGLPFNPNDGTWASIFGGVNNAQLSLSQTVAVPNDAMLTRVTFSRCWVTEELMGALDTLTLELINANGGAVLQTLLDISNEDAEATCEWTAVEIAIDPTPATALELRFTAATDGATATTFAFDSLAVEASVCR